MEPMTYEEQFQSALECNNPDQAAAWLTTEVKRYVDQFGRTPELAKRLILQNLRWMAQYFDDRTIEKIALLFGTEGPEQMLAGLEKRMAPR